MQKDESLCAFGVLHTIPRCNRIATRSSFRSNERPQQIGMLEQRVLDLFRHLERLQSLFKDLPAARKMSSHDRMIRMRFADGPATILNIGAQEFGRQLIFHFLDPSAIGVPEKKSDHTVLEHSIDKRVDNRPEPIFPTELFEQTIVHE